jgi:hypothetical protein
LRPRYKAGKRPDHISTFVDTLARLIFSLCAGLALSVPTVIMALDAGKTTTLVTVCVSVLLFATTTSIAVKLANKDIFIATATYAAVLVVFLGITSEKSP